MRTAARGMPGAAVLLVTDGEARVAAAGLADRASGERLRGDERFRIGSVTKTFVAALVLDLAGRGLLGLDDELERWLPGVVPQPKGISLRHLLTHTSGLGNYVEHPDGLEFAFLRPGPAPRELLALGAALPRRSRPGERFDYSNTNFLALGLVAEAAGGAPLREQLERRIFRPLDLRDTDFLLRRQIAGRHARGYLGLDAVSLQGRTPAELGVGADLDVTEEDPAAAWASGGIVSTLADVARFWQALLGGRLLLPALTRELTTDGGKGMVHVELPCGGAWGKGGEMAGYVTRVTAAADGSRVAVAMINRSGPEAIGRVIALSQTAFCLAAQ